MGLILSGNATSKDVGLPTYPRSKPHKEKSNDSPSARLGLWGESAGFKLSIMKMNTSDSPEKVATFYKKALAKYGRVLDCSNPSPAQSDADSNGSSQALTCDGDGPQKDEMVFKSGTKERQHIVVIKPDGQGSYYQLLAIEDWNKENKK